MVPPWHHGTNNLLHNTTPTPLRIPPDYAWYWFWWKQNKKKTVQLLTCYLNIYIFSYIWSESKKGSKIKGEKNSLWIHLLDTSPVKCGCKERIVHRTKQLSAKDHRRKWGENTWPKTTKYIHEKNWGPLFFFLLFNKKMMRGWRVRWTRRELWSRIQVCCVIVTRTFRQMIKSQNIVHCCSKLSSSDYIGNVRYYISSTGWNMKNYHFKNEIAYSNDTIFNCCYIQDQIWG